MNTIIWMAKSFYKMLILMILLEIFGIEQDWWYDTLLIVGFASCVFSSIPYTFKK